MCRASCRVGAIVSVALFPAGSGLGQSYTVTDIGALPDATPTIPTPPNSGTSAINADGVVAGTSSISGGFVWISPGHGVAEPWITHAVRWVDSELADLGVLGEDTPIDVFPRPGSFAWGINGLGQVVGDADIVEDGYYHGFLWLPEEDYGLPAGMSEVPPLNTYARAHDINDAGTIVGESRLLPGSLGPRAMRWTVADGQWTITDLGSFGQEYSIAYGINNLGQITGYATIIVPPFQDNSHAFLWLPEPAYGLPAGLNNLTHGLPAGSIGRDVNELGQVVGRSPAWTPMIWLPEPAYGLPAGVTQFSPATMFSPEVLAEFGLLAAGFGEFYAINNDGVAVGNVQFAVLLPNGDIGGTQRGIVWKDGEFFLTQQFLPPGSSFVSIFRSEDVNDAGQIAASAADADSNSHGVVLTPTTSGDCDADGDIDNADYAEFHGCLSGPGNAIAPACTCFDFDQDVDADLLDFAQIQVSFTGAP